MCRLFLVKSENKELQRKLLEGLFRLSMEKGNNDGYLLKTKRRTVRTLEFEEILRAIKRTKSKLAIGHARMATSGSISEKNIHGWELGSWGFAHNGTVSRLGGISYWTRNRYYQDIWERGGKCDSFKFFERLLEKKVNEKNIRKAINRYGFSGTAFLYKTDLSELWILSEKDFYIANVEGGRAFIISSQRDILVELPEVAIKTTFKIRRAVWFLEFWEEEVIRQPIFEKGLKVEIHRVPRGIYHTEL